MKKMVKCLIYCTKSKDNQLIRYYGNKHTLITKKNTIMPNPDFYLNGKIVAQFDCEKVERFDVPYPAYFWEVKDELEHITNGSCLSLMSLHHYLKNKKGYAIHISNLEIFEKPKELSDFVYLTCGYEQCSKCKYYSVWYDCYAQEYPIEKAPQNMMNVWKRRNTFNIETSERRKEQYILISIRPEWVAKILNGEKTIEVRKSIVNKLKELI